MTKDDVIRRSCAITGLVYHSIRDYRDPSDCFCSEHAPKDWNFAHAGKTLDYIREAVLEKLIREGRPISQAMLKATER